PREVINGGAYRVKFQYGTSGTDRDRVMSQLWGTNETASFLYMSPGVAQSTDALGQVRKYALDPPPADLFADRIHIKEERTVNAPPFRERDKRARSLSRRTSAHHADHPPHDLSAGHELHGRARGERPAHQLGRAASQSQRSAGREQLCRREARIHRSGAAEES